MSASDQEVVAGMKYEVDQKEKKTLHKLVIQQTEKAKYFYILARILLIGGCVLSLGYLLIFCINPNMGIVNVRGVPTKEYAGAIGSTVRRIIIFLVCFWGFNFWAGKLAGIDISERIDEELLLTNGVLRYTFRIKFHSNGRDRNVIIIPLSDIRAHDYDHEKKKVVLYGEFSSDYIANYAGSGFVEPDGRNLSEFVFYNYFSPSLLDIFEGDGIKKKQ